MKIGFITRFLETRRAYHATKARMSEEQKKNRLSAANETIKQEVHEVMEHLKTMGYTVGSRYSTNSEYSNGTFYVVGKDNSTYKVIVQPKGGYAMEKL